MLLVPEARIELATYPLPRGCATTTLLRRPCVADGQTTRGGGYNPADPEGQRGMKIKSSFRQDRLAAALRENLKRRKARERALTTGAVSQGASPPEPRPNKAKKVD